MMDVFLYDQFLEIMGYLLIGVFLPLSAAPIKIKCPVNQFFNSAIERCDLCSIYCDTNNPHYLNVCQRKCTSVYDQLMNTTQTILSTAPTSIQTVSPTSHHDEASTSQAVTLPVTATFSTLEIAGICLGSLVGAVLVILPIVILAKRLSRESSGSALSCLGGSKETLSTPVQVESGTGSQELSSLSSQSLENTEETQPLNSEAPEQNIVL